VTNTGLTVVAQALNDAGSVDSSYNGMVTIFILTNPGGSSLSGQVTVQAQNGIATFNGLSLNHPGTGYVLQVSASGLAPAATTPFSEQAPPVITGATAVFTQKHNRKGKPIGKPVLTGYQFTFDEAMNTSSLANSLNYSLGQYIRVTVKVGKKRVKQLQLRPISFGVQVINSSTLQLNVFGKPAFKLGGQITLIASGINNGQNGGALDGTGGGIAGVNAVYNLSRGGLSISHA
jgi:hypothetical protein